MKKLCKEIYAYQDELLLSNQIQVILIKNKTTVF